MKKIAILQSNYIPGADAKLHLLDDVSFFLKILN
jgi:hypothetical protein